MAVSSSPEVCPPLQRIRMAASTLAPASRLEPRRYLPLRSVLVVSTTSTVYSAIHPRTGFPAQHSWGSAHLPGIPASRGPLRYRRGLPLLNLMTGPASAVTSASTRPSVLQGFAHRGDRRRSHSVSLMQGLVSLRLHWVGPRSVRCRTTPKGCLTSYLCASKLASGSSRHRSGPSLPSVASLELSEDRLAPATRRRHELRGPMRATVRTVRSVPSRVPNCKRASHSRSADRC